MKLEDVIRTDQIQTLEQVDDDARHAVLRVMDVLHRDFDKINPNSQEFHIDGYHDSELGWHISIRFVQRNLDD